MTEPSEKTKPWRGYSLPAGRPIRSGVPEPAQQAERLFGQALDEVRADPGRQPLAAMLGSWLARAAGNYAPARAL
jgi:hypothetical protein